MKIFNTKFLSVVGILSILSVAIIIYTCNAEIEDRAKGNLYDDTKTIPFNKVALLLGTSKYLKSGSINPYYKNRIEAAVQLYNSGKVRYIVISGDNSTKNYNEPDQMRADLVLSKIDSSNIYLDYAGFRTFDSIIRLKEIFGQDSVTIVSQPFHNKRAIYIASQEGITAIGYNAKDVSRSFGLKVQVREKLARVKVFIDYLFGQKPKFLGDKIKIH